MNAYGVTIVAWVPPPRLEGDNDLKHPWPLAKSIIFNPDSDRGKI
jgi:hypothetical protein